MDNDFVLLVFAGFAAQLVDGALGMGFGIVGTTIMLWIGLTPAHASALVHFGEVFTTGASGLSHMAMRNIDWRYVRRLAPAGMAGGGLGAYGLAEFDGEAIRPLVMAYLALMGGLIILRAWRGAAGPTVRAPRLVIGSVNLTEFFVTTTISATFILSLGIGDIRPILGFLIGGVLAAPLAGVITRVAPATTLRIAVGSFVLIVTALQTYKLVTS